MERDAYILMATQEADHWWYRARRNILKHLYLFHKTAGEISILEAACGTGGNLPMLASLGRVYAFEKNPLAREYATAKQVGHIAEGTLPDAIPFPDKQFDAVFCCDVLEHLEDPLTALQALKAKLTPDGMMIITVPAYPWMWSWHDVFHHHHRRYTRRDLHTLLRQAGCEILLLSHFNTFLFPIALLVRCGEKLLPRRHQKQQQPLLSATPKGWLNTLLCAVMSCEKWLIPLHPLPFGLSLIAVVKIGDLKHKELHKNITEKD